MIDQLHGCNTMQILFLFLVILYYCWVQSTTKKQLTTIFTLKFSSNFGLDDVDILVCFFFDRIIRLIKGKGCVVNCSGYEVIHYALVIIGEELALVQQAASVFVTLSMLN